MTLIGEEKIVDLNTDLCPEVRVFAIAMQKQINNNRYKDSAGERGWKRDSDLLAVHNLYEDVRDLVTAVNHLSHPLGGDERNAPSPEQILKEASDIGCRALIIADVCGSLTE